MQAAAPLRQSAGRSCEAGVQRLRGAPGGCFRPFACLVPDSVQPCERSRARHRAAFGGQRARLPPVALVSRIVRLCRDRAPEFLPPCRPAVSVGGPAGRPGCFLQGAAVDCGGTCRGQSRPAALACAGVVRQDGARMQGGRKAPGRLRARARIRQCCMAKKRVDETFRFV